MLPNREWGSAAHHHPQADSGGRGLVRKGNGSFIQKLHRLGGWQALVSRPITSRTPRGSPAVLCQTSPRLCLLPFRTPSFGNRRRLQHSRPGSLACFRLQSGLRRLLESIRGAHAAIAMLLSGPSQSTKHCSPHVHTSGSLPSV